MTLRLKSNSTHNQKFILQIFLAYLPCASHYYRQGRSKTAPNFLLFTVFILLGGDCQWTN